MRYCFLDTSAFAKLFAVEPGMRTVRDLLRSAKARPEWNRPVLCDLTLAETFSAVTNIQAGREAASKGLGAAALRELLPRIRLHFGAESPFLVVPATGCMELAADLVGRRRLRAPTAFSLRRPFVRGTLPAIHTDYS